MPTINSNIFKCDACRKDFKTVWIPNKLCCRIAMGEQKARSQGNTYSRHMTKQQDRLTESQAMSSDAKKIVDFAKERGRSSSKAAMNTTIEIGKIYRNCIAPFSTLGKPTCGHFFSRETDHRKRKIGIPPSNLVQWRSYVS